MVGDGFEPAVMERAGVAAAAGFVAGTDNDTSNLSLIAAARRVNPDLWVAARQNLPTSESLFAVMEVDALLVPTEVVAHEVFAQLSTPLLWRFLQEVPALGDAWAAELLDRMTDRCGQELPPLWKVRLTPAGDPGADRLADLRLGPARRPAAQPGRPGPAAAGGAADGAARRGVRAGARTTTSCSRRTTSCCCPGRPGPAARWA